MLKLTLCLSVAAFTWGLASCDVTCPDGDTCPDYNTCCLTKDGYGCCRYTNAMCCDDLASCCPSGTVCNLVARTCENKNQPWLNVPMARKEAAEKPNPPAQSVIPLQEQENNHVPDKEQISFIYCDPYYMCPDMTTCCRRPGAPWTCCPYYRGTCCPDGVHCCPYAYHCDSTSTRCLTRGLRFPFLPVQTLATVLATRISPQDELNNGPLNKKPTTPLTEAIGSRNEDRIVRCDPLFYCPGGTSCCKGSEGQWGCCPYKLGHCCADGLHCCEYGSTCDSTSSSCSREKAQEFAKIP